MTVSIHRSHDENHLALVELYRDAVAAAGPSAYTPEQLRAWLSGADDMEAFCRKMFSGQTFIAADAGRPVGFACLHDDGYVAAVFVLGDQQRRGVGSLLMTELIAEAKRRGMTKLWGRASVFSQGLFEKYGFHVAYWQDTEYRGAVFHQPIMERQLDGDLS